MKDKKQKPRPHYCPKCGNRFTAFNRRFGHGCDRCTFIAR